MSQLGEAPAMASASGAAVTISNQVMVAAVIFLFMVVIFIFFLYLYAKYYIGSNPSLRRARGGFVFADSDQIAIGGRGLDAELLKSLPIKSYSPSEFKNGLECAVCLSELSEGEQLRLLPKCSHGFHVECIDMWFDSHTTCPLCRASVTLTGEAEVEAEDGNSLNLNFPTNVLFWGNQDQVSNGVASSAQTEEGTSSSSSSSKLSKKPEGMLVIDIPRRGVEEFVSPMVSPLPTSKFPSEETKTPRSARLRCLTKLLSRGKMVITSSSSSPKGGDIEQGVVVGSSSLGPKTPTSK